MKPLYAVIVLMTMICSAAMSSINSYRATESLIVSDLNRALEKTLEQKREGWMTPDTLRVYRK
ncbi:MAG: helix-turn-helix domain-containing protein, partial [Prevotella sp.]